MGSGTYGLVIRARDTTDPDARDVAIKLLPRGGFVSAAPTADATKRAKQAAADFSISWKALSLLRYTAPRSQQRFCGASRATMFAWPPPLVAEQFVVRGCGFFPLFGRYSSQ